MIHIMKLQPQYYNYIKNGTKEYEIRLNDEKRKNIRKGDFIQFQKEPLLEEKIIVKVDDVLHYDNFNKLLNDINIELLADSSVAKEKLDNDLEKFYPIEEQNEYGVVAIKLKKGIIISNTNINNISSNNEIFDILKNNYDNFDVWLNKMKSDNIDIYYTENENKITSIMILKINEIDSQQFLEDGNILKLRSLLINDKNKGIGKMYLDIANNIAISNSINYIYLTAKKDNKELFNYIEKKGYKKYKQYNEEFIYYKEIK